MTRGPLSDYITRRITEVGRALIQEAVDEEEGPRCPECGARNPHGTECQRHEEER